MQKDLSNYMKERYMYVFNKKSIYNEFINISIRKLIADDSVYHFRLNIAKN